MPSLAAAELTASSIAEQPGGPPPFGVGDTRSRADRVELHAVATRYDELADPPVLAPGVSDGIYSRARADPSFLGTSLPPKSVRLQLYQQ
ncbi:hypothetical protein [Nocardia sp. NPDC019395]|uniref:hypothetical protein n=1 Tax=Nocardia sp. NPDC019395 TaxID=3154686 RepID=UPI0033F08DA4